MIDGAPRQMTVLGFDCDLYEDLGHLIVAHDGSITWDQLQAVKNEVWGRDARAIEIYPRAGDVVNTGHWRHLWRLGEGDFAPDLLGHEAGRFAGICSDSLEQRSYRAWYGAGRVFR